MPHISDSYMHNCRTCIISVEDQPRFSPIISIIICSFSTMLFHIRISVQDDRIFPKCSVSSPLCSAILSSVLFDTQLFKVGMCFHGTENAANLYGIDDRLCSSTVCVALSTPCYWVESRVSRRIASYPSVFNKYKDLTREVNQHR